MTGKLFSRNSKIEFLTIILENEIEILITEKTRGSGKPEPRFLKGSKAIL